MINQEHSDRVATPTRPPRYIPAYNNSGGGTIPTISQHGVEGEKTYVKITSPFNQQQGAHDKLEHKSPAPHRTDSDRSARMALVHLENTPRINNTPADISSVTLVGKATPLEQHRNHHKSRASSSVTEVSNLALAVNTVESAEAVFMEEMEELLPNHLNINIPAVDMISASSAAGVNSIADFLEFDNQAVKPAKDTKDNDIMLVDVHREEQECGSSVAGSSLDGYKEPASIAASTDEEAGFAISVDVDVKLTSEHKT